MGTRRPSGVSNCAGQSRSSVCVCSQVSDGAQRLGQVHRAQLGLGPPLAKMRQQPVLGPRQQACFAAIGQVRPSAAREFDARPQAARGFAPRQADLAQPVQRGARDGIGRARRARAVGEDQRAEPLLPAGHHAPVAPRPVADVAPADAVGEECAQVVFGQIGIACRIRASRRSPSRSVATIRRAPESGRPGSIAAPLPPESTQRGASPGRRSPIRSG